MVRFEPISTTLLLICCLCSLIATAQEDSPKKEARQSLIYMRYYAINNRVPYLEVQTKNKVGKAFLPQAKVPVTIYLNNNGDAESRMGQIVTNEKGVASMGLPASLASRWKERANPIFYARTDSSANFNAAHEELLVTKARLELDTVNDGGARSLRARLLKYENASLVPMPEIDVRLAVKRLGGYLNIGEEESYSTDSAGYAQGEYKRTDLPGELGNLEVVALVDDNDEVGTLETRMTVPWGIRFKVADNFNKRSLYATGNKAPVWLMLMAYGCIIGVWAVIVYLVVNIVKIKRDARSVS